jgi:hypothetical protein
VNGCLASAGTIRPTTFGGGLSATEIRGWSTDFGQEIQTWGCSWPVPTARSALGHGQGDEKRRCQRQPGGSFPVAAGTYCSIVWSNDNLNGDRAKCAENCGTVSA